MKAARRHAPSVVARTVWLALIIATAAVGIGASATAAQDEPSPRPSGRDLYLDMPYYLGGYEPQIEMSRGEDHFVGLDPDDPADVRTREVLETLLETSDAEVEDLVSGYALVSLDDFFAFVVGIRIDGSDASELIPLYLPSLIDRLVDPEVETTTIAGREVQVVRSTGDDDIEVPLHVFASRDTMWLVQGPDDIIAATIANLP